MIDISWENTSECFRDHDTYRKLCQGSVPSDFYFHVYEIDEDGTNVAICSKAYFEKEGNCWDQSVDLSHILPEDMCESMESIWDCDRSLVEVRIDLLARGFVECEKFSDYVKVLVK